MEDVGEEWHNNNNNIIYYRSGYVPICLSVPSTAAQGIRPREVPCHYSFSRVGWLGAKEAAAVWWNGLVVVKEHGKLFFLSRSNQKGFLRIGAKTKRPALGPAII